MEMTKMKKTNFRFSRKTDTKKRQLSGAAQLPLNCCSTPAQLPLYLSKRPTSQDAFQAL
jgi:hypothetical protein